MSKSGFSSPALSTLGYSARSSHLQFVNLDPGDYFIVRPDFGAQLRYPMADRASVLRKDEHGLASIVNPDLDENDETIIEIADDVPVVKLLGLD